eukprot:352049-Amphidinium_carterae.1
MEQQYAESYRVHQDVSELERRDLQLRAVSYRTTIEYEDDVAYPEHQGDIKSWLLMNTNLATDEFDNSANKVEEYYRNVYIDNNGGQVAGVQKPQKPWKPWKPWKPRKGEGKGKDYGKDKGGKDNYQPWKGYDKGGIGKNGKSYYNKGKGKGATTTAKERTKATEETFKDRHYHPTTTTTGKERKEEKEKGGKNTDIVCYYCGKPGHTSDKCWWKQKGQLYNIDQPQPIWSLPNDNQAQPLQPVPQSAATTTILTQPQQQPNISLYEQQYAIRSVTGSTLVVDKDNTTADQLGRWAILIDTGAITSVASREHFSHIPIKQL